MKHKWKFKFWQGGGGLERRANVQRSFKEQKNIDEAQLYETDILEKNTRQVYQSGFSRETATIEDSYIGLYQEIYFKEPHILFLRPSVYWKSLICIINGNLLYLKSTDNRF